MPAHPLPLLLNNGVSVALCSDDPAVFGNMGLSFDFFQVSDLLIHILFHDAVLVLMDRLGTCCK